jgi:hypothetical protein
MKKQHFLRRQQAAAHLDKLLDEALEQTFPASDAVGIDFEEPVTSLQAAAVAPTPTDQAKQQSRETSDGSVSVTAFDARHERTMR